MKYLKENSLIKNYKKDFDNVKKLYQEYKTALKNLDNYSPKLYKMLTSLLDSIPREGDSIADWEINQWKWDDVKLGELNQRRPFSSEVLKCFIRDKNGKWYYAIEDSRFMKNMPIVDYLIKNGHTDESLSSDYIRSLDTITPYAMYEIIEGIMKTPALLKYYNSNFFKKVNESKGLTNILRQYDEKIRSIENEYHDKFYNIIGKIIDKVGEEKISEIIFEDYQHGDSILIEENSGYLTGFSKKGVVYYVHYELNYIDEEMRLYDLKSRQLSWILDHLIHHETIMSFFNKSTFNKMNEDFTDRYRTNGYMITDENAEKMCKMLSKVLDKIHGSDIYDEMVDEFRELYLSDGVMFSDFTFHFSDKIWYIDTIESEYDDNGDWIEDKYETYPIKDFDPKIVAVFLDELMGNPRVLQELNKETFKKMNENKWVKTFELFNTEADINIIDETDKLFKVEFTIDNDLYFFKAEHEDNVYPENIRYGWHISFGKGYDKDKYLPTNKNLPFKVLNSVKKSLDIFINNYSPEKMSFIAEGDIKSSIYLKLLKGYKITKEESGLDSLTGDIPYLFKLDSLGFSNH